MDSSNHCSTSDFFMNRSMVKSDWNWAIRAKSSSSGSLSQLQHSRHSSKSELWQSSKGLKYGDNESEQLETGVVVVLVDGEMATGMALNGSSNKASSRTGRCIDGGE
jgi:hypothetical protein